MNQDPLLNPYAPPTADTDQAIWPTQQAGDEPLLADRGTRLGAAILDTLLYAACMIPGIVIGTMSGLTDHSYGQEKVYTIVGLGILFVLPLAIYQWYKIATTGQSLAKKWLRIRIVKMDNSPVDFVSGVLLRAWVPQIIFTVVNAVVSVNILGLVDVLWIFGNARRCLHDYIAGTKVVLA